MYENISKAKTQTLKRYEYWWSLTNFTRATKIFFHFVLLFVYLQKKRIREPSKYKVVDIGGYENLTSVFNMEKVSQKEQRSLKSKRDVFIFIRPGSLCPRVCLENILVGKYQLV